MDNALRIAAAIVLVIAAFSVLIMGMFATNAGNPNVMIVGTGIIVGAAAGLLLMILARFASRPFASRQGAGGGRTALVVTMAVYGVGVPALVLGTWQCITLLLEAPAYQEAGIEAPNSIPQF